jgi:type II secretory ATPase GspE/PulE/Tfp pilus assembly ATPase PilB-like protein
MDIGVEPFFVSSALQMVVAQRLLRRLCEKCKEAYKPAPNQMPSNFKMTAATLYKAKGCDKCSKTGYAGRMPIFEILFMTDKIQEMILRKASATEIKAEACKNGMRTIEESGFLKVNEGLSSMEEVLRLTMAGGF